MTVHFFIDRAGGTLGALERTPQGGVRVNATIAKVGLLEYTAGYLRKQGNEIAASYQDSDVLKIYNPPEVLQAALPSLRDAPVTREHPAKMVTPENFRQVARGAVGAACFESGFVMGPLVIQDSELISDIEMNARREVSAGYGAVTDYTPGVADDGTKYDGIRTRIIYNHVAVVKQGRAGETVCLALDSADIPNFSDEVPVALKINGAEVAADKAQAAYDSFEGAVVADKAKLQSALDAALVTVKDLETKLATATSDSAIDTAVSARIAKTEAAKLAADKLAKLKAAFPKQSFDSKSQDFLDGAYESLVASTASGEAGVIKIAADKPVTKTDVKPVVDARGEMLKERATAWVKPA